MNDLLPYVIAGAIAQMIDGALGMGFGVSATTMLLTLGVAPAGAYHHWRQRNVVMAFAKKLMLPGIAGAIAGAYVLTTIPADVIKPFIAAYLMVMGLIILAKAWRASTRVGSEKNLTMLGLSGGFFDAVGGGGWGPIVVGTLLARGNSPRTTIGSVNFAEFFVTFAASATLLLTIGTTNWMPIAGLALGGAAAAPLAARLTGRLPARPLLIAVGILVIALSVRTIFLAVR
jgi:uncharacterized membrane protein YfcA